MQTTTQTVSVITNTVSARYQPRSEQPVYRIKATESIEDLCRLNEDEDGFETGDFTDALLLD